MPSSRTWSPLHAVLALALAIALLAALPAAATQEGPRDVIVVFASDASLDANAPEAGLRGSAPEGAYVDPGVLGTVRLLERQLWFRASNVYSASVRGFSARLWPLQIELLEDLPLIDYVADDGPVETASHSPGQILPWGIDRVDADISSTLAGDGQGSVEGVSVYVIDTGIDTGHPDLNVVQHLNFVPGPNRDCNGHGSHVAGTIAALDNNFGVVGVAPGAPLTGLRVLGCNGRGSWSDVLAGIDWVAGNASGPAVASLALIGPPNRAVDQALRNSALLSTFYAVAAGNDGEDACLSSPASLGANADNGIMTTAAIDMDDAETIWSNFGSCVDIWAPGENIPSTWTNRRYLTLSGTSMAAAHTAGTAALYLSNNPTATPAQVEEQLRLFSEQPGGQQVDSKDGRPIGVIYNGAF